MEDIQFTVGDRVHATTSEGVSLVSGETYKIAKIGVALNQPVYWITGKPTGSVKTLAFRHQLEL